MNPAGAANLGNAYGKITLDASGVQNAVNQARSSLNGLQSIGGSIQSMGQSLTSFGTNMTVALAPVTGFVTQGIFAFSRFQDVMAEIQARTGLVGEDLEAIRQTALQMGADTAFSATQAAQAFLELTSSGQSSNDALVTLPHVLNLAAAGALDLGYAADGLTDIMAQFGLPVQAVSDHVWELADKFGTSREEFELWDSDIGKITPGMQQLAASMGMSVREMADYINKSEDAARVTDILAAAASASSADVTDLIEAFRNGGSAASMFGLSVEETAATFAVFAENGIKGAEAGTQLKSMLTNMTRNTDDVQQMWRDLGVSMFDATGQARPLNDVIQDLNRAMEGMSDQERIDVIQTLAGTYGQAGLNALLASDGIWAMERSMRNQTSASEVAAARMNTFSGRIESLKGSIETLSINFLGPLVENYLTPLAEQLIEIINGVNDWVLGNEDLAAKIALVVGGLAIAGPIIAAIGMYLSTFGGLIAVVGGAFGLLVSPLGLVVAGAVALGAALMYLTDTSLEDLINLLGEAVRWLAAFSSGLVAAFQSNGLEGIGTYVLTNLVAPLLAAIASIDFAEIVGAMATRLITALNGVSLTAWSAGEWLNTHIVNPLHEAVTKKDWADIGARAGASISSAFQDGMEAQRDAFGASMDIIPQETEQAIPHLSHQGGHLSGELVGSFIAGLITSLPSVVFAFNQLIYEVVRDVTLATAQLIAAGAVAAWHFAGGFVEGLVVKSPDILHALAIIFAQIALFVIAQYNTFVKIAGNIIDGIKDGILATNLGQWFVTQFNSIVQQVKQFLGIASPSTLFAQIGHDIGQGLINGLLAMVNPIGAAAAALYNAVVGPLNNIITLANRAINAASGAVSSAVGSPIGGSNQVNVEIPEGLQLPGRASGGSARRDKSYLVGELGPEPFTPNANGGIMPNDVWEALKSIAFSLSGPSLAGAMVSAGGGKGGDVYQIAVSVPADLLRDEPRLRDHAETFADALQVALQKKSVA